MCSLLACSASRAFYISSSRLLITTFFFGLTCSVDSLCAYTSPLMNSSGSVVSTNSSLKVLGLKILRYAVAVPGRDCSLGRLGHVEVSSSHYENHKLDHLCEIILKLYLHRNSARDSMVNQDIDHTSLQSHPYLSSLCRRGAYLSKVPHFSRHSS